jgi:ADP-ribose pyrophosphatase
MKPNPSSFKGRSSTIEACDMPNLDWKVLDSTYIVKDRWLSLRSDICRMPDGRTIAPYYVFEYPAWVNVVALTEGGKVVLVRQYRHGLQRTLIELPCGCVEARDASPLAAAKRELLEESGYTSERFIETGLLSANPATHTNMTHCFLATNVRQIAEPALDDTEQIEVMLTPLEEVIERTNNGGFLQALHISSLFFALRALGRLQIR